LDSKQVDLILSGASGRMGREILKLVIGNDNFRLIGALENKNCVEIGQDAVKFIGQNSGIIITDNADSISFKSQNNLVLIDFSNPKNAINMLDICVSKSIGMVVGTTGFSEKELLLLKQASKIIPILCAPNMSVGVNKVFAILKEAVKYFDNNYDVEIFEAHHRDKLDAPSGTALKLGEAISTSLGDKLTKEIKYFSERYGEVIGDHKVKMESSTETLIFSHSTTTRQVFVDGAIKASKWIIGKSAGFYCMQDVLFSELK